MKILFIWDGDYPWDIRVEKVCKALIDQGHTVHLVCRNTKRQSRYEFYTGIHIHRLASLPRVLGRANDAFTFPAFFNPIWLWEILKRATREKCQLIIIRDLPLALAGVLVAKLKGLPTILDMAECYPELLRAVWQFERFKLLNIIVRNPLLADMVETLTLKLVDEVIVMVEESRDRLVRKDFPSSRIYIVSNTPEVGRFLDSSHDVDQSPRACLKLLYVGLLNPSRGLDIVIEAVEKYIALNPDFRFTVIGTGKAESSLRRLTQLRRLERIVEFKGWVDNAQLPAYIRAHDIGIVPHRRCTHWNNTIPNKLFDYMLAGKPVAVSDVTPMARIVNETESGVVYRDDDPDDLVRVLCQLEDANLRQMLGNNARRAVVTKYNWQLDSIHLDAAIRKLANNS